MKKKIVQDTFRKYLPDELYNRPKHGFEIPLLDWFRKELRSKIADEWLNKDFIAEQKIFDVKAVEQLKEKLNSYLIFKEEKTISFFEVAPQPAP